MYVLYNTVLGLERFRSCALDAILGIVFCRLISGAKVRCVPPIYMYSRLPKLFVIKDPLPDSFVGLLFYIHVI